MTIRHRLRLTAASLLVLALPAGAFANTSHVFGPGVSAGSAFDARIAYTPSDDGRLSVLSSRLHYQWAFDDDLRTRLIAAGRSVDGDSIDYQFTRLELQWQYRRPASNGWQAALRFEAQNGHGSPDRFRVAWTGQLDLGERWFLTLNALVGRQFGSRAASGLQLETRARMSYRLATSSSLGFEMYNGLNTTAEMGSFDAQDHEVGVLYTGRLSEGWHLNAGLLSGLSDAADKQTFRLYVVRSF